MHDGSGEVEDGARPPATALNEPEIDFTGKCPGAKIRICACPDLPAQIRLQYADSLAYRQAPPITNQRLDLGTVQQRVNAGDIA